MLQGFARSYCAEHASVCIICPGTKIIGTLNGRVRIEHRGEVMQRWKA